MSSVGLALGKKISQTEDVDSVCTYRLEDLECFIEFIKQVG